MAYKPTSKTQTFQATRITVHSPKPYEDVLNSLYSSIGSPDAADAWPKTAKKITEYTDEAREAFIKRIKATVGPHDFMLFQVFDHGIWIPLFGEGNGLKGRRVILGNPLIAITMLRRELTAGLAVPVEILVLEKSEADGGGTDVVYNLPSGLIAGLNGDEELVNAVAALDGKLGRLVEWVLS